MFNIIQKLRDINDARVKEIRSISTVIYEQCEASKVAEGQVLMLKSEYILNKVSSINNWELTESLTNKHLSDEVLEALTRNKWKMNKLEFDMSALDNFSSEFKLSRNSPYTRQQQAMILLELELLDTE